jgi:hypothetical protein
MATRGRIRRSIELDEDAVVEFNKYYPTRGALTWFVEKALKRFLEIHTQKPEELIHEVVDEISGLTEEIE